MVISYLSTINQTSTGQEHGSYNNGACPEQKHHPYNR